MLKNAYILEKIVKNCLSVGGSAPEPPATSGGSAPRLPYFYSRLLFQLFASSYLALKYVVTLKKEQNSYKNCCAFVSTALLRL